MYAAHDAAGGPWLHVPLREIAAHERTAANAGRLSFARPNLCARVPDAEDPLHDLRRRGAPWLPSELDHELTRKVGLFGEQLEVPVYRERQRSRPCPFGSYPCARRDRIDHYSDQETAEDDEEPEEDHAGGIQIEQTDRGNHHE